MISSNSFFFSEDSSYSDSILAGSAISSLTGGFKGCFMVQDSLSSRRFLKAAFFV